MRNRRVTIVRWSMIAALLLALAAPTPAGGNGRDAPVFSEEDGVVVVEVESVEPTGLWEAETKLEGFTGRCYYTWTGKGINHSGRAGPLVYKIKITTPGTYQLRIRNRHDHKDATLENDCFTQMDDGEPTKTYSSRRGCWTWWSNHEHKHGGKAPASYDLTAGLHTFTICGRSGGFSIDRFVLYRKDQEQAALDPTREETDGLPSMPDLAALGRVGKYWERGELGRALAAAERETDADDAAEAAAASKAVEALEAFAAQRQEKLTALKETAPAAAAKGLEALAKRFGGSDLGREFKKTARAWSKEPAVVRARKAAKVLAKIEAKALPLAKKGKASDPKFFARFEDDLKWIRKGIEVLREKYPDTPACKRAEALAEKLGIPLS